MCVRLAFWILLMLYTGGSSSKMMYRAAKILTQNNLPSPHLVIQAHFRIFPELRGKSSPSSLHSTLSLSPRLYVHFCAFQKAKDCCSFTDFRTFNEKIFQTLLEGESSPYCCPAVPPNHYYPQYPLAVRGLRTFAFVCAITNFFSLPLKSAKISLSLVSSYMCHIFFFRQFPVMSF